jgi:imidazoleglycerol phosphate dehydratase HisB
MAARTEDGIDIEVHLLVPLGIAGVDDALVRQALHHLLEEVGVSLGVAEHRLDEALGEVGAVEGDG